AITTESAASAEVAPRAVNGTWNAIVSRSSEFLMESRTVVPAGTRTSGPGTSDGFDSSPNVGSSRPGFAGPSGYHIVRFASSASVRTPLRSDPAGVVLALRTAVEDEGERSNPTDNDIRRATAHGVRIVDAPDRF